MNVSGRGRSDAWMIAIPLAALLVFTSYANGGSSGFLTTLDGIVRGAFTAVANFVANVF